MQVDKHLLEKFPRSDINTQRTDVHNLTKLVGNSSRRSDAILRAASPGINLLLPDPTSAFFTFHRGKIRTGENHDDEKRAVGLSINIEGEGELEEKFVGIFYGRGPGCPVEAFRMSSRLVFSTT
jgi:hypothetical protein